MSLFSLGLLGQTRPKGVKYVIPFFWSMRLVGSNLYGTSLHRCIAYMTSVQFLKFLFGFVCTDGFEASQTERIESAVWIAPMREEWSRTVWQMRALATIIRRTWSQNSGCKRNQKVPSRFLR
jgi:hypothetical protein